MTIPKRIAERYRLAPGSEIEWLPAGDAIRVVPGGAAAPVDRVRRLELYDRTTARVREREAAPPGAAAERGWSRDELYDRAGAR